MPSIAVGCCFGDIFPAVQMWTFCFQSNLHLTLIGKKSESNCSSVTCFAFKWQHLCTNMCRSELLLLLLLPRVVRLRSWLLNGWPHGGLFSPVICRRSSVVFTESCSPFCKKKKIITRPMTLAWKKIMSKNALLRIKGANWCLSQG